MASKKKQAISDLIKSDMAQRTIGELSQTPEEVPNEIVVEKTMGRKPLAAKPIVYSNDRETAFSAGINNFINFATEKTESAGLKDEDDIQKFYDFLQNQTLRYIRGFDAARRFYGQ